MKPKARLRYLLCLLALWGCAAGAWAHELRIVWVVVDWPPFMVLKDGRAPASAQALGSGSVERMMAEIIARLPQYRHEFQLSNTQRMWPAMQRGQNYCYPMAAKSAERMNHAFFTPIALLPPQALVFNAKQRESLVGAATGQVSLIKLLREHGEQGRLLETRAYGEQLDALIEVHGQTLKRELMASTGSLLHPLSAGLFGFTLEYPSVVEYARRQGELAGPLEMTGVAEAQDWFSGYVACTRNVWGRQVVADIDGAIRKSAGTPAFRNAIAAWLPPDYAKAHAERMRAFYDARAKGRAQID